MGRLRTYPDPRLPEAVVPFQLRQAEQPDAIAEMIGMVGMMMGLGGVILRMKWIAWTSFFLNILALTSSKSSDGEGRTTASSLSFSVMALTGTYMTYFQQQAANKAKMDS
ncbi:hypothetical protein DFS34DRAFT_310886 [Phlyctochytrium arcticum]|nr:hypothetical protein DFS34DRAFT_310886 [Phlyctochytrium arcticum]